MAEKQTIEIDKDEFFEILRGVAQLKEDMFEELRQINQKVGYLYRDRVDKNKALGIELPN